jgi:hypothetical protein
LAAVNSVPLGFVVFPGAADWRNKNSKFSLLGLASWKSITILPAPFQFAMPLPDYD